MRLNILVTMPRGEIFDTFFGRERILELEALGTVEWNEGCEQFSQEELCERIAGKDICVTGWGSPLFDEKVLAHADRLKLIAHTGGSVKPIVTDAVYERGIRVVSGNRVFAESVAEGVIAYALAALRDIPYYSAQVKAGFWRPKFENRGLLDRSVGIVGYGMIAGYVVQMLEPFHSRIKVFSRHISEEELKRHNMQKAELDEIFSTCDIISIHCGMTAENYHLVTGDLLKKMKPGALLINTARGPIIEENALVKALQEQDIRAVLDVFDIEPLPVDHPLLSCDNAILMPHMAGPTVDRRIAVTHAVIRDIRNFLEGLPLECEITKSYAAKMSVR